MLLKIKEEFFDYISPEIFTVAVIDNIDDYKTFSLNKNNKEASYHHYIYGDISFKKDEIILKLDEIKLDINFIKIGFFKVFYDYKVFWIGDCYFYEI